jgi:Zn-dependent protease with chaperone function
VSISGLRALAPGLGTVLLLGAAVGGCAGLLTGSDDSASPSTSSTSRPTSTKAPTSRPVDGAQAQRLQRIMTPLINAMDNPLPLKQVKVGIMDDPQINAASAGGGEFYVTRGLLEKANDQHLAGVIAHELAHDDLRHVAKTQALGTGISIGMVLLDQIIPGSGAVASIPGRLLMNRYTQSEEYAADQHGMEILQKAGMPPTIMADTLTWLMQTEGGSSGGFFSTHPATSDRIEALRRGR